MKLQFESMPRARLLLGVAAIVVATSGIAAKMVWTPALVEGDAALALDGGPVRPENALAMTSCFGCGIIVALRVLEASGDGSEKTELGKAAKSSPRYEVTVRLKDGASRRFVDAAPAKWRLGERVIFIDGNGPSND